MVKKLKVFANSEDVIAEYDDVSNDISERLAVLKAKKKKQRAKQKHKNGGGDGGKRVTRKSKVAYDGKSKRRSKFISPPDIPKTPTLLTRPALSMMKHEKRNKISPPIRKKEKSSPKKKSPPPLNTQPNPTPDMCTKPKPSPRSVRIRNRKLHQRRDRAKSQLFSYFSKFMGNSPGLEVLEDEIWSEHGGLYIMVVIQFYTYSEMEAAKMSEISDEILKDMGGCVCQQGLSAFVCTFETPNEALNASSEVLKIFEELGLRDKCSITLTSEEILEFPVLQSVGGYTCETLAPPDWNKCHSQPGELLISWKVLPPDVVQECATSTQGKDGYFSLTNMMMSGESACPKNMEKAKKIMCYKLDEETLVNVGLADSLLREHNESNTQRGSSQNWVCVYVKGLKRIYQQRCFVHYWAMLFKMREIAVACASSHGGELCETSKRCILLNFDSKWKALKASVQILNRCHELNCQLENFMDRFEVGIGISKGAGACICAQTLAKNNCQYGQILLTKRLYADYIRECEDDLFCAVQEVAESVFVCQPEYCNDLYYSIFLHSDDEKWHEIVQTILSLPDNVYRKALHALGKACHMKCDEDKLMRDCEYRKIQASECQQESDVRRYTAEARSFADQAFAKHQSYLKATAQLHGYLPNYEEIQLDWLQCLSTNKSDGKTREYYRNMVIKSPTEENRKKRRKTPPKTPKASPKSKKGNSSGYGMQIAALATAGAFVVSNLLF